MIFINSSHGMIASSLSKNSILLVLAALNSSFISAIVICLSMSLLYHFFPLAIVRCCLNLLAEANFLETIMITTVVSKKNITELDNIKELLKTLPIHSWRICPVAPIGRANNDCELLLNKEQIHYVYDYIQHCRHEYLLYSVTTSCSHYLGK